jgi:hypothetical protein
MLKIIRQPTCRHGRLPLSFVESLAALFRWCSSGCFAYSPPRFGVVYFMCMKGEAGQSETFLFGAIVLVLLGLLSHVHCRELTRLHNAVHVPESASGFREMFRWGRGRARAASNMWHVFATLRLQTHGSRYLSNVVVCIYLQFALRPLHSV